MKQCCLCGKSGHKSSDCEWHDDFKSWTDYLCKIIDRELHLHRHVKDCEDSERVAEKCRQSNQS